MRGKAESESDTGRHSGITPAYAGKRERGSFAAPAFWDHPRLCGEKEMSGFSLMEKPRITPAYAGKRQEILKKRRQNQDHPRLCGEKFIFRILFP